MTARLDLLSLARNTGAATSLFIKDIGQGLLVVSHNTLALVGLAVVAVLLTFASQAELRQQLEGQARGWLHARQEARNIADGNTLIGNEEPDAIARATAVDPKELAVVAVLLMFLSQADLRHRIESQAFGWLSARQEARAEAEGNTLFGSAEPEAVTRATASNPKELPRQQAAVAMWLSRRYKVAPEPVSRLVQEAWAVGQRARVEPTLILAIMAIESSFNPFAQSAVGAQGLMQVMTRVHDDKYEAFGGNLAAFDPITNLRVGVQVLKECIQRAGSVEEGLRYYVGAANLPDDAGYAARVMAEHEQMKAVAAGRNMPTQVTPKPLREAATPTVTPAPAEERIALLR